MHARIPARKCPTCPCWVYTNLKSTRAKHIRGVLICESNLIGILCQPPPDQNMKLICRKSKTHSHEFEPTFHNHRHIETIGRVYCVMTWIGWNPICRRSSYECAFFMTWGFSIAGWYSGFSHFSKHWNDRLLDWFRDLVGGDLATCPGPCTNRVAAKPHRIGPKPYVLGTRRRAVQLAVAALKARHGVLASRPSGLDARTPWLAASGGPRGAECCS